MGLRPFCFTFSLQSSACLPEHLLTTVNNLFHCGPIMKILLSPRLICFLLIAITSAPPLSAAEEAKDPGQSKKAESSPAEAPQEKSYTSVEERRLYDTLERERAGLQEKIKVLADKEKELKTLEQEVDKKFELMEKKIQELKKVQQQTEELLARKDQEEMKKIQELSKMYSKMDPEKAALALSALADQQLAADIIAGMKTKSAAKVMEQLDKLKASALTTTLSTLSTE